MYEKNILTEAKKRARQYKCKTVLGLLILFAIPVILFFLNGYFGIFNSYVIVVYIFVHYLFLRRANLRNFKKYIVSATLNDKDPELQAAVLSELKYRRTNTVWISTQRLLGNYQNAITICNRVLSDPKLRDGAKSRAAIYITEIAECYFELGDDERLRAAVEGFYRFTSNHRKGERIERALPKMRFFRMYLNREYEGCLSYIATPLPANAMYIPSSNELRRGMVYLRMGDAERARAEFERAVELAPKLSCATAAARQLRLMEHPEEADNAEAVLPLPDCPDMRSGSGSGVKITIAAVIFAVLYFCLLKGASYAGEMIAYERDMRSYAQTVEAAVKRDYDEAEFLTAINLTEDGEIICVLAFCKTEDGLAVGEMMFYEEYYGESEVTLFDTVKLIPYDVITGEGESTQVSFYSKCASLYVGGCFYTDKDHRPEKARHTVGMNVNGKTLWFSVDYLGALPPKE